MVTNLNWNELLQDDNKRTLAYSEPCIDWKKFKETNQPYPPKNVSNINRYSAENVQERTILSNFHYCIESEYAFDVTPLRFKTYAEIAGDNRINQSYYQDKK